MINLPTKQTRSAMSRLQTKPWRLLNASALSEARFHESVKLGEVLCARSIERFEGGRWRLRRMRANGWTRANGYADQTRISSVLDFLMRCQLIRT